MTAREAFGVELRRRRGQAQLSLSQLAARVHYSKSHLSKIESGSQSVTTTFARMCDAALEANGELLALAAEPPPAAADRADDGLDDDYWSVRLDPDGIGHFAPVAGHGADFAATFGPNFAAGQYPIDPAIAIPLFRGRFDQARSFGQLVNAALTLPMLIAETHILRSLASKASADASAGLWRLAAHYAEYLGWMSQESGSNRQALYWTRIAVRMAIRGGYESLRPFALVREADMTLYEDDGHQTIELSRQAAADTAADSRIRGLAAQREAQG
ncbi:MAG TPA: helix-turn-helix transcriptional regulator, partial [Pseudonocardiaceae bacterium]